MKKIILIGAVVSIAFGTLTLYNINREKQRTDELISFTENLKSQEIQRIPESATSKKVVSPAQVAIVPNPTKDCGTNFDCFIESSKICSQAKVNQIVSMDFSYEVKNDVDFEIKGTKDDKCQVSFNIKSSTLSFINDQGASLEMKNQVKSMMKDAQEEVDKKLDEHSLNNCSFKDKTLTTILEGMKKSGFHLSMNSDTYKVLENLSNNNCNGPFILN